MPEKKPQQPPGNPEIIGSILPTLRAASGQDKRRSAAHSALVCHLQQADVNRALENQPSGAVGAVTRLRDPLSMKTRPQSKPVVLLDLGHEFGTMGFLRGY